jgi:hypothetical protein
MRDDSTSSHLFHFVWLENFNIFYPLFLLYLFWDIVWKGKVHSGIQHRFVKVSEYNYSYLVCFPRVVASLRNLDVLLYKSEPAPLAVGSNYLSQFRPHLKIGAGHRIYIPPSTRPIIQS